VKLSPSQQYWAQFTPEERSAEMARRARASAKRGGKMIGGKKPKRTPSPESIAAVEAAQKELARRKRDAERHREYRAEKKTGKVTPSKTQKHSKAMKGFWATMTPEQRTAEMKRRRAVAREKRAQLSTEPSRAAA
jgi:hypothetical protein